MSLVNSSTLEAALVAQPDAPLAHQAPFVPAAVMVNSSTPTTNVLPPAQMEPSPMQPPNSALHVIRLARNVLPSKAARPVHPTTHSITKSAWWTQPAPLAPSTTTEFAPSVKTTARNVVHRPPALFVLVHSYSAVAIAFLHALMVNSRTLMATAQNARSNVALAIKLISAAPAPTHSS